MSALTGFSIVHREQVRWGDLDAFGHVNNTVFFCYFESARIAYFPAATLIENVICVEGAGRILGQASCQFLRPIRFPCELLVGVRVTEVRTNSFKMEYAIVDAKAPSDLPFARGDSVIVMIDFGTGTRGPLSEALRARFAELDKIA